MAFIVNQMKMSHEGLEHLTKAEGCRLKIYNDVAGYPTIGVGHLITEEELSSGLIYGISYKSGISMEDCLAILAEDVKDAEAAVNKLVRVYITQNQFDALVSFVFNIGRYAFSRSTLLRKLNKQDRASVPYEMRRWVKAGGKTIPGLKNRREAEIAVWNGPRLS
jgi:lysozyme